MNAYLKAKQDKYNKIKSEIDGLQTRSVDEKRELTDDELRSITEKAGELKTLAEEIEQLAEIENRNAKVAQVAAGLPQDPAAGEAEGQGAGEGKPETVGAEVRNSSTSAVDRDPGHYRSVKAGGSHSFFNDLMRAKEDDTDAKQRLMEHHRALSSSSAGTGILPPKWLTEYAGVARQQRRVAARVRQIALGNDPRPITLPKQTAATAVGTQSAENATTTWTDAFNTGVDTVTPSTVVGGQKVSRQLLDASSPAVDELIYGDLLADYDSKVEARVVAAMVTAAGTATTAYANEAAYTTAITPTATGVPFLKNLRGCATSVRNLRKLPADIVVATVNRYGGWLDITDTQGRPLIPVAEYNPVNASGVGQVNVDGRILGLDILATDGIAAAYPESIVVARSQDTILFESNTLRFRYEEPDGPETIRLGVWGYVGVLTRYAGASTQRLQITAA